MHRLWVSPLITWLGRYSSIHTLSIITCLEAYLYLSPGDQSFCQPIVCALYHKRRSFIIPLIVFRNLYITAVTNTEDSFISNSNTQALLNNGVRHKRMSEPRLADTGIVYVSTSDGRYLRRVVAGRLQMPTAIIALPQIGRICYADAGYQAKIECADMDGNMRQVCFLALWTEQIHNINIYFNKPLTRWLSASWYILRPRWL